MRAIRYRSYGLLVGLIAALLIQPACQSESSWRPQAVQRYEERNTFHAAVLQDTQEQPVLIEEPDVLLDRPPAAEPTTRPVDDGIGEHVPDLEAAYELALQGRKTAEGRERIYHDHVVHLLDENNLNPLGTCISLDGKPRKDKPAMKVKIVADYGDEKDILEETVLGGHLFVYPLPMGRTAEVWVRCMGRARINGKRRVKLTLNGGLAGLIFDARGRPLPVSDDVRERAIQFPMWVQEMTDDPLLVIDEAWLQETETTEAPPQEEKKRRGRRRKKDKKADEALGIDMEGLEDLDDIDLDEGDDLEAGLDELLADLGDLDDLDDEDQLSELRDVLS